MKRFNKIAIIGIGLIGGSIGLTAKKKQLAKKVVGICRRPESVIAAKEAGAVDEVTEDYDKGLEDVDLAIIATPVGKIVDIAKEIKKHAKKEIIVTDVGSTKELIVKEVEKITRDSNIKFVGAHPMAGSEKSGVKFASDNLFSNSICILTPTNKTNKNAFETVEKFWISLGAKCEILSPDEHDKYISLISHLPHIAAIALIIEADEKGESLKYASTGFKDTTRIASSNPNLWQDIFITNKDALLRALKDYKCALEGIERSIENEKTENLIALLKRAKDVRDSLN